ncbi:MAG: D-Ala-D-Ala carboxypeptidase family metallohydrolase, partial [Gemmatimonas sp.]
MKLLISKGLRRVILGLGGLVAVLGLQLYEPPPELMAGSAPVNEKLRVPAVRAGKQAFGSSGDVKMVFARAGETIAYPLEVAGNDASGFTYQWIRLSDSTSGDVERGVAGDTLLVPLEAGFYELVVSRAGVRQRIKEPKLAVTVPFELKLGSSLNGYRIGRYPAEWSHDESAERPAGFAEVQENEMDLPLTQHLKVRDFITHDRQTVWPRYAAIDPRVLDKIELVMRELARRRGDDRMDFKIEVHSGFRTPDHNAGVEGSARDSRHLYGDAADVAIDADGDGRLTIFDAYRVEMAVDWVEKMHPELAGGLGVYSSRRFPTPYCHI